MFKTVCMMALSLLLLTSCSNTRTEPIVISTSAWIGYSPLFYAREKGWLKEANMELLSVVSLGESMHLYESGSSDVFTGTQHEFEKQREVKNDLIPFMLFDRSNGGDAIMANRTIKQLTTSKEKITVYMEMDSINEELLSYFSNKYEISKDRFSILNRSQDEIQTLDAHSIDEPTLIVTYDPYNLKLAKNGFMEIASTRDESALFVIDAMYTSSNLFYENKEQFIKLNAIIERSLQALQKDPKEYYETVKAYLDNPSYDDFNHMLTNIEWIHKKPSDTMVKNLESIHFPSKDILE